MGDNVMLYVDDIQHCHTEFLQKFISLCDAQRRIEGVYRGRTRTYDLRGRKVAVVMAGNPYTESGEMFQIPDMLANRADVYNLGEIIGDTREAFELSYLENALTSNATLNRVASRGANDIHAMIKAAESDTRDGIEVEANYTADELSECLSVIRKLLRVRDVVLRVNREYIRSAAQSDDYRTEPPFKLQGSYRNMNRIAEKVVPVMNDEELDTLILSSYENDAQTLTSDTESNLLKFKELFGKLNADETRRWEEIQKAYRRNVRLRGVGGDDSAGMLIAELGSLGDALESIGGAVADGVARSSHRDASSDRIEREVGSLRVIVDEMRARWTAPAPPADPNVAPAPLAADRDVEMQRILVQHKVPKSILDVVRSQFELMRGWLEPLLAAADRQSSETDRLRATVESCVGAYERLVRELDEANRTTRASPKAKKQDKPSDR